MNYRRLPTITLPTTGGRYRLYVDAEVEPERYEFDRTGAAVYVNEIYHENGTPLDQETFSEYEQEIVDRYLEAIRQKI